MRSVLAGKFLVMQYPIFGAVLTPVSAVARIYFSTPLLGLGVFFAIYLGIVNNQSLDRSVRFNALQAVLLDIILMCAPTPASAHCPCRCLCVFAQPVPRAVVVPSVPVAPSCASNAAALTLAPVHVRVSESLQPRELITGRVVSVCERQLRLTQ